MSDVNLVFTVNSVSSTFTVDTTTVNVTPNTTAINMFAGYAAYPPNGVAGNSQVLFNDAGLFAGDPTFTFDKTENRLTVNNFSVTDNANLGSVTNLRILGGVAGQYLTSLGSGGVGFSTLTPGGSTSQLQYNDNGTFAGIPTVTYSAGALSLGDAGNVKILGGDNGFVLQTDGTGNLTWTAQTGGTPGNGSPGGSNTQVQFNDAGVFGGDPGFVYNKTTDTLSLGNITVSGNATSNNFVSNSIYVDSILHANGSPWQFITSPGGSNTQVQYNNNGSFGAISGLTYDSGNSLLTIGTTTQITSNVDITGTPTLHHGRESAYFTTATSGSYNVDVLTNGAINWFTFELTNNLSINVRGSSSVLFSDVVSVGQTLTIVLSTSVGAAIYYPSVFNIDGNVKTVKWVNGFTPSISTISPNSTVVYTYTITRTDTSAYTILGSFTGYM